jgi:tRNA(adenine34) deaminase
MPIQENHIRFMRLALIEAEKAGQIDEVPVGALLVSARGEILAAAHNQTITLTDPTAHAEILVLRSAAIKINNYRLLDSTLYVTVEPCSMCMGALIHARVATLVYGAKDPKWGAADSLYRIGSDQRHNHRIEVVAGVLEAECRELMQRFFRAKRTGAPDNDR